MANLGKPGTATPNILSDTNTDIGVAGNVFYFKVMSADLSFHTKVAETTGDGDTANEPFFENSGITYGRWVMRGAMIAGQALGLAKLRTVVGTDTNNPLTTVVFKLTGDREITVDGLLIEAINVAWRKNAPYVGVSMICHVNNTIAES